MDKIDNDTAISAEVLKSIFIQLDNGELFRIKNMKLAGTIASNGYRLIKIKGRVYLAHRILWAINYGEWPSKELDHINGDKLDNRISNLRMVTRAQNNWNVKKKKNNTSGYKGIFLHKKSGKWYSTIRHSGKRYHLGYFSNIEDAIKERKNAEHKYHGQYCYGAKT